MTKPRHKQIQSVFILVFLLLASLAYGDRQLAIAPEAVPLYRPRNIPFNAGEEAVYRASWNGVPVATAKVHTVPLWVEGKKFYQVRVEAKTSKVLDLIWRMRDTISSTFEAKSLAPSRFVFNQRENRKVTDTHAVYDRVNKKWIVNRQRGKKLTNFEFDSPNTLDPITAVYLARSLELRMGEKLYFNVFGGKSRYLLELEVEGKEKIELDSGKHDALKIVPRITNITKDGYAGRVREATVWISADEKRTPLLLASKVFIGTVYIELVQEKEGGRPSGVEPDVSPS